jgi:hypothetical protein
MVISTVEEVRPMHDLSQSQTQSVSVVSHLIKGVPAETCGDCHEPFMSGKITDDVVALVSQLKRLGSEISVVSFRDYAVT